MNVTIIERSRKKSKFSKQTQAPLLAFPPDDLDDRSAEDARQQATATGAYQQAEGRGFASGNEEEDRL